MQTHQHPPAPPEQLQALLDQLAGLEPGSAAWEAWQTALSEDDANAMRVWAEAVARLVMEPLPLERLFAARVAAAMRRTRPAMRLSRLSKRHHWCL
jgi:hypothetical protein